MSNTLMTLAEIATGLASVAALAGYHLFLPAPGIALSNTGFAADDPRPAEPMTGRFDVLRHRQDALPSLDEHLLRDVGLTRGFMDSIKSADGRPRGLYADMIHERLHHL